MKNIKRIIVFIFIGFICFNSVFFSYQKAYTSDAAAIPLSEALFEILFSLATIGGTIEAVDNWENLTDDEWLKAYNQEKDLYDDFKSYCIEYEGSDSLYITDGNGQVCYLDDILAQDFPDEEEFKKLKKKSKKKKFNSSDWWMYADELLDILEEFFDEEDGDNDNDDDDDDNDYTSGGSFTPQYYYTGDEGYINRETGDLFIHLNSTMNGSARDNANLTTIYYNNLYLLDHEEELTDCKESYRAAVYLEGTNVAFNTYFYETDGTSTFVPFRYQGKGNVLYSKTGAVFDTGIYATGDRIREYDVGLGEYKNYNLPDDLYRKMFVYYSCRYEKVDGVDTYDLYDWDYLSSNLPIFKTYDEAKNYILTGDASLALNLPPTVTVTPTPAPGPTTTSPSSGRTACKCYCDCLKGKWVNSDMIEEFLDALKEFCEENGLIPNNTDPDYVDAVDDLANSEVSPTPTEKPYDGYDEDKENDGEGFSLWKFFEWLLSFFTLDMDKINKSLTVDFVPAASFKTLIAAFDNMKTAFGTDSYEESTESSSTESSSNDEINVETSVGINSGKLNTNYPIISCKVPKILDPYLKTNGKSIKTEDGEKVIVLCDFADYAVYFARFRAFLIAVMWVGMLFYLMKEFQVTFNIS